MQTIQGLHSLQATYKSSVLTDGMKLGRPSVVIATVGSGWGRGHVIHGRGSLKFQTSIMHGREEWEGGSDSQTKTHIFNNTALQSEEKK